MKNKNFWKNMLIGFFGGMVSGLFSSGGGLILVPYMSSILKMVGNLWFLLVKLMIIHCLLELSGIINLSHF